MKVLKAVRAAFPEHQWSIGANKEIVCDGEVMRTKWHSDEKLDEIANTLRDVHGPSLDLEEELVNAIVQSIAMEFELRGERG